jgi:hypothetical protein
MARQKAKPAKTPALESLRSNAMMRRLLEALERGEDIGHYGRFVFVIVSRYFLDEETIADLVTSDSFPRERAKAMIDQAKQRDYSPPTRETILEWQAEQRFQIIPNPLDPDAGNVYKDLRFPPNVYEHIEEYHEAKIKASEN